MIIKSIKTSFTIVMLCLALVVGLTARVQSQGRAKPKTRLQKVTVALTEEGYQPTTFKLRRGIPAQITFIRKVSATCGTQVVIPEYDIKRALPLNEPVILEFTPNRSGKFTFSCGMGMLRGSLVVQ